MRVEAIKTAGLKLFLERGTDGVTIDEIAREAGTAKGNFYRYFESKADLVEAVFEPMQRGFIEAGGECLDDLKTAAPGSDITAHYRKFAQRIAMQIAQDPLSVQLYLQEHNAAASPERAAMQTLAAQIRETALRMTEAAVRAGLLDVSEPHVTSLAVIGSAEALALAALKSDYPINPPQAIQQLVAMVMNGLSPRGANGRGRPV